MFNRPETKTPAYKKWVRAVIIKYKKKCIACNKFTLIAHHMDSWDLYYSLRYDPENGVLLCGGKFGCHNQFHKLYGYGNNNRYQLDCYLRLYHNKKLEDIL